MSSEEIDTDNSANSRSDVSSLDAGFMKMQVESSSSEEEFSDNELDSQAGLPDRKCKIQNFFLQNQKIIRKFFSKIRNKSESIVFETNNDKHDGTLTPNTLFNFYSSSHTLFARYVVIKTTK